jgi:hypothetical protein
MAAERRICALCGRVFLAILPVGRKPHPSDQLCGNCAFLPKPPVAPYESDPSETGRPDAGDRPRRADDEPEEPTTA